MTYEHGASKKLLLNTIKSKFFGYNNNTKYKPRSSSDRSVEGSVTRRPMQNCHLGY